MLSLILPPFLQRWISNHLARINSVHINILLITLKLIWILSAPLSEKLGCRGPKAVQVLSHAFWALWIYISWNLGQRRLSYIPKVICWARSRVRNKSRFLVTLNCCITFLPGLAIILVVCNTLNRFFFAVHLTFVFSAKYETVVNACLMFGGVRYQQSSSLFSFSWFCFFFFLILFNFLLKKIIESRSIEDIYPQR